MPYTTLLACHLVAVAIFLAGLFTAAALLPGLTRDRPPAELRRILWMSYVVTTPALLLVWTFGIAMALEAGWFAAGWLQTKLALVLLLSGWHSRQVRSLRRLVAGRPVRPAWLRTILIPAAMVAAIVVLVAVKPF